MKTDSSSDTSKKTAKIFRYLTYAIGEIVLVILGILIALQINNWNIENKNQREARSFSTRFLSEVRTNIKITDAAILRLTKIVGSSQGLLEMFHIDPTHLSSRGMDSLINDILGNAAINLKLATFTEGLNTGKVAMISSDSLRSLLYGLPSVIERVKVSESIVSDDLDDNFYPYLTDNFNYRQMDATFSPYKEQSGKSAFPDHNNFKAFKSLHFENIIENRFYNAISQVERYQELKRSFEQLERFLRE